MQVPVNALRIAWFIFSTKYFLFCALRLTARFCNWEWDFDISLFISTGKPQRFPVHFIQGRAVFDMSGELSYRFVFETLRLTARAVECDTVQLSASPYFFPSALISWVSHKEPVPRLRTHCCANTPGLTSSLECFIWRQIKEEAGEVGVSSYCLRSFRCHHFLYLKDSVMESFGASSQTNPARRVYRSQITVFTFLRFFSCGVLEGFTLDRCKSSEILFSSDVLQIKKTRSHVITFELEKL